MNKKPKALDVVSIPSTKNAKIIPAISNTPISINLYLIKFSSLRYFSIYSTRIINDHVLTINFFIFSYVSIHQY